MQDIFALWRTALILDVWIKSAVWNGLCTLTAAPITKYLELSTDQKENTLSKHFLC